MNARCPGEELQGHRRSLWDYYDRRVARRMPGLLNARAYWSGLGVDVDCDDIALEARNLEHRLRQLPPQQFVDVGAGPGSFTGLLPGKGIAVDQSHRALDALRALIPGVPVVRADAFHLPLANQSVRRFFSSHLYGLLLPGERQDFLAEARRVAAEILILDAGCPDGVSAEEWQDRVLPDGGRYRVFRRHFSAGTLAAEVGGDVLFDGQFYVLVLAI